MNKQIEALKMEVDDARIGLGKVRQYLGWQEPKEDELCLEILKAWKTLDACKEALAEAALNEMQKNAEELGLTYCKHGSDDACKECYMEQAEAEKQEPVAWIKVVDGRFSPSFSYKFSKQKRDGYIPLYTHPTPSWQSLSDDERIQIYISDPAIASYDDPQLIKYARAIEQALKEKNT